MRYLKMTLLSRKTYLKKTWPMRVTEMLTMMVRMTKKSEQHKLRWNEAGKTNLLSSFSLSHNN